LRIYQLIMLELRLIKVELSKQEKLWKLYSFLLRNTEPNYIIKPELRKSRRTTSS